MMGAGDEQKRESLVAELRHRGIRFLAPSDAQLGPERLTDEALLIALLQHPDPRLRFSLIPWFILHPELHSMLPSLLPRLPLEERTELKVLYTAAVYLQRLWRTRLRLYLGEFQELPDLFSAELGLPSPMERYGKVGLHALARWHTEHSDHLFNRLASYTKMMDLLFDQLKRGAGEHASRTR